MSYELTPFEQLFTPLIDYATNFNKYEENAQYFKALPDAIDGLIHYITLELGKSPSSASDLPTQVNKVATEIAMVFRTLMLTQYRTIQRSLFKLIKALSFDGSKIPRRLLRNGCQILMARHLEVHSMDHTAEDSIITDCIGAMITVDPQGISTAIINAVASIATDKADALQLACITLCQQMVVCGVSHSEPAMRVFFEQLTEPERLSEVYISSAIILRLISSQRTPEEAAKIRNHIDKLLVPLSTKTEMPDEEDDGQDRHSKIEHIREAEDIQKDIDDVVLKIRILESNRQTIEKAMQNVSDMMMMISEQLDATNQNIHLLSHTVHNYHKVLNKLGDDNSKHQQEVSTRKDLLLAQQNYQHEDHKRAELENKLVQIQSAKTAYLEKHTALTAQIAGLEKKETTLYEELKQKQESQQRIVDTTLFNATTRIPNSPTDKNNRQDMQGRRLRPSNLGPSSLKNGAGNTALQFNKVDMSTDEVGKQLIFHMYRVRQDAADARLKQQPHKYEYQTGAKGARVSSKTELCKCLLQCLLSTHTGLLYLLSLPSGLKGIFNNLLTLSEFDGTKRAIYELLFDILGDKYIFKPRFLSRFAPPEQLMLLRNSATFQNFDLQRAQSTVGFPDSNLSHTSTTKAGFQHKQGNGGLRPMDTKSSLFTGTTNLKSKQGSATLPIQPSHLHHLLAFAGESSQTNSVIESQDYPLPQLNEYKHFGMQGPTDIYMYNSSNYGALAALSMELSPNFNISLSSSFSGVLTSERNLLELLFIDELYLVSLGCSTSYGHYTDFDVATDHMMWTLITLARAGLVEVLCWELLSESSMSYGPALMLLTLFLSKCVQLLPKTYCNPIISLSGFISYYMGSYSGKNKTTINPKGMSQFLLGSSSLILNSFLNFQHSIFTYAELYEFVFTQGYFNQYVSQINLSQQQLELHRYMQQKEIERHGENSTSDNLLDRLRQLVETRSKIKFSDIIKTYITINNNTFAQKMLKERVLHINLELYWIRLDFLDQAIQKLFAELVSTKSSMRMGISAVECKAGFDLYYSRIDNFLKTNELSEYPIYWNWNSIATLIGFLCNQFGHAGETKEEVTRIWSKVAPVFENIITFMDGSIKRKYESIHKLRKSRHKKTQSNDDTILCSGASTINLASVSFERNINSHKFLRPVGSSIPTSSSQQYLTTPITVNSGCRSLFPATSSDQLQAHSLISPSQPMIGFYEGAESEDFNFYHQYYDLRLLTLFEMPITEYTLYICRTCLNLISLLVRYSEGIAFIQKSQLAATIYDILDAACNERGLLTIDNYKANLSLSVVSILGILSSTDLGLYVLSSPSSQNSHGNNLWNIIERLIKQGTRHELVQHIIMSLNYSATVTQISLLPGIVELYTSTSEKANTMNHSLTNKDSKEKGNNLNYTIDLKSPADPKSNKLPSDCVLTVQDITPPDHFKVLFQALNRESRACMTEALKSTNVSTRYFATFHIAAMIRQRHAFLKEYYVTCLCSSCLSVFTYHFTDLRAHSIQLKTLSDVFWAAECLVNQCRDPITEVSICALIALEELSLERNDLILEYIVSLKPPLLTYGRIGEVLIERLASCNIGLQYLIEERDILPQLLEYWSDGLAPGLEWTMNFEARAYSNIDLGIPQNYSLPFFFRERISHKTRNDAASLTFYKADELMYDNLVMPHHTRLGRSSLYLPSSAADMPPAFREVFITNMGQIKERDPKANGLNKNEKSFFSSSFLATESMIGVLNKGMSNPCGFFSDYMNQYNGPDSFHKQRVSNILPTYLRPCLLAELAKTTRGCELILKKGIFKTIMQILLDPVKNRFLLQYRAALWAVTLIAQSEVGFKEIIAKASLDPTIDYIKHDSISLSNDTFDGNDEEATSVYTTQSVGSSLITGDLFGAAWHTHNGMANMVAGQSQASIISGHQFHGLSICDAPMIGNRGRINAVSGHRGGTIPNIFGKSSCSVSHTYEISSQYSTSNESVLHSGRDKIAPLIILHLIHYLAIFSDSYPVKRTATMCISHCCHNARLRRYFIENLGWEVTRLSRSGESYGCLPPVELFETFYRLKPLSDKEVETFIINPLKGIHTSQSLRTQNESQMCSQSTSRITGRDAIRDESMPVTVGMTPSHANMSTGFTSSLNIRCKQPIQSNASTLSLEITEEKLEEIKALLKYTITDTSPLPVDLTEDNAFDYIWCNLEHIYDWEFVLRNFKLEERYRELGLIEPIKHTDENKTKTNQSTLEEEGTVVTTTAKSELRLLAEQAATRVKSIKLLHTREYSTNAQAYLPCGCKAGILIPRAAYHELEMKKDVCTPVGGTLTNISLVNKFQSICRKFTLTLSKETFFYLIHDNDNTDMINSFIQSVSVEAAKIQRKNKKFARSNEVTMISILRSPERTNTFESQILMYCNYLLSAYEPDVQQASAAIGILVDNSMPYRNSNIDYCQMDNVPRESFFLVISQILATWPLLPIARHALLRVCDRPTLRTLKVLDELSTFAEDTDMTGLA